MSQPIPEIKVPRAKLPLADTNVYLRDHDHRRHLPQVYPRNNDAHARGNRNNFKGVARSTEPYDTFTLNPRQ